MLAFASLVLLVLLSKINEQVHLHLQQTTTPWLLDTGVWASAAGTPRTFISLRFRTKEIARVQHQHPFIIVCVHYMHVRYNFFFNFQHSIWTFGIYILYFLRNLNCIRTNNSKINNNDDAHIDNSSYTALQKKFVFSRSVRLSKYVLVSWQLKFKFRMSMGVRWPLSVKFKQRTSTFYTVGCYALIYIHKCIADRSTVWIWSRKRRKWLSLTK